MDRRILFLPFNSGPPRATARTYSAARALPNLPERPQPGEKRLSALRFVHVHVEDDSDQKDQPLHGPHPGAGEARGDEAGLDHADDEAAEQSAEDGRASPENRCAADQHRGDGGQEIALALVAEKVLVLEREHDRGAGGQKTHEGEDLDLFAIDVDADDSRHVIRIADEQSVLAESVPIEDKPEKADDNRRPQRLDRDLRQPGSIHRSEGTSNDPLPDRALIGAAQRIGLAPGQDRRHAGPEELGSERGHERRDADLRDNDAIDESDQDSRRQAGDDGKPTEIIFLEQDGEDESRKGDDRGKAEIDLPRPDHEGEPRCKQDQRRQCGKKRRIDIGGEEHFRRPIHEQRQKQRVDDDDRQRLEALREGLTRFLSHPVYP